LLSFELGIRSFDSTALSILFEAIFSFGFDSNREIFGLYATKFAGGHETALKTHVCILFSQSENF